MFILQLSDLFDAASITQDLRDHVDAFITSANTFLGAQIVLVSLTAC